MTFQGMATVDEITVSGQSENRSLALSDGKAEKIAIAGWQYIREQLPGPIESDEAFRGKIRFLKEIVFEAGEERFVHAVQQVIRTSDKRSDASVKRLREFAGLDVSGPQSAAASAWDLVTRVVKSHVKRDGEGNVVLKSAIRMIGGNRGEIVPVPEISEAVTRAVQAMGGWGNLAEAYPAWWGQKFVQFKEVYRP